MRKSILLLMSIMVIVACQKQSNINKNFNCNIENHKDVKQYTDFNKNFKIKIPSHFNTSLYYNSHQSEIFTADTTKQLSESFILKTSFNHGEIDFNNDFYHKTDSLIKRNNFELVSSKNDIIKEKNAYWYVVKGIKKEFTYHQLNLILKLSTNTYFSATTDLYGENNINERICASLSIFKTIEFFE